jgi:hypothetical protein
MSLTYRQQIFMAPLSRRRKITREEDPHGIGRSPRFVPGWWLVGVGAFYAAVAALCIFVL